MIGIDIFLFLFLVYFILFYFFSFLFWFGFHSQFSVLYFDSAVLYCIFKFFMQLLHTHISTSRLHPSCRNSLSLQVSYNLNVVTLCCIFRCIYYSLNFCGLNWFQVIGVYFSLDIISCFQVHQQHCRFCLYLFLFLFLFFSFFPTSHTSKHTALLFILFYFIFLPTLVLFFIFHYQPTLFFCSLPSLLYCTAQKMCFANISCLHCHWTILHLKCHPESTTSSILCPS